jgi:hypothetical protein
VSPATPWWTRVLKVHVAMEGVISDVGGEGDDPRVDLSLGCQEEITSLG